MEVERPRTVGGVIARLESSLSLFLSAAWSESYGPNWKQNLVADPG
jgi:hypothetical protein